MLCLWNGPIFGEVDMMGIALLLSPRAVAYFGMFFGFGWWLHRRPHQLEGLRTPLVLYFLAALAAFLTLGACHSLRIRPANPNYINVELLAIAAASIYAWTMTFAVTGLFLRFAAKHRPWVRYLADASYWWYLWHLPLVLWLQVLVAPLPLPGVVKFVFILAANVAVLLPTYHWLVRYTWIGRMLNGPRSRPLAVAPD
jgi:glucan biosynthesis protein C